ncbi:MAG: hypothetical protein QNL48_11505, partial [Alcaligenes aquatilis]
AMWPGEFIPLEKLAHNEPNMQEALRALLLYWMRFQKSDRNQQDAYNILAKSAQYAWKFAQAEIERANAAQQPVSGADQFRDAAQMIEPSGKIDEDAEFMGWLNATCTYDDLNNPEIELAKDAWQARAALAQQDAMLDSRIAADMAVIVETLDEGEWAEHIAKTDLGQRLERHITQLVGKQQDADPLQGAADWLVKDCGVSDLVELAGRLSIGYNRASRLVDAARKEQA